MMARAECKMNFAEAKPIFAGDFFKSTAKVRSFWETTKYFGNFLQKNFCRAVFCWKMSGISRFFLIFASSTNLKYEE